MLRRTSLWLVVTASATLLVPAAPASAQTASGTSVVTTLTAFDAPPELGGRVINSAPLVPPAPGADPLAVLSDLTGPVAALLAGEASSFEAATGQSSSAPRAAAAAAQDVTLADCYANDLSKAPKVGSSSTCGTATSLS